MKIADWPEHWREYISDLLVEAGIDFEDAGEIVERFRSAVLAELEANGIRVVPTAKRPRGWNLIQGATNREWRVFNEVVQKERTRISH